MPINILIIVIGGAVLTFAIRNYGTMGILIFYLPIFLSTYAFRLYVRRMQQQVDTLEQKVVDWKRLAHCRCSCLNNVLEPTKKALRGREPA